MGVFGELAEENGVSESTVRDVLAGRTWSDNKREPTVWENKDHLPYVPRVESKHLSREDARLCRALYARGTDPWDMSFDFGWSMGSIRLAIQ